MLGIAYAVHLVRLEGSVLDLDGHFAEEEISSGGDITVWPQGRELVASLGDRVLTLAVSRLDKVYALNTEARLLVRGLRLLGSESADNDVCVFDDLVHGVLFPFGYAPA